MLKRNLRAIRYMDSSADDVSLNFQNDLGVIHDFGTTGEALYIGQDFPFNQFHVEMSVANATSGAELSVEYYCDNNWRSAVEVLDATVSGDAPFGQNGVIQFEPNRDYGWSPVSDTSEDSDTILSQFTIYDKYWMRVRSSAALDASTKIKKIAYQFCSSSDLIDIDPEVNDYLTSWESTKTDWDRQIQLASRLIIEELRQKNLLLNGNQILKVEDVNLACQYRTLMVIYANLGEKFKPKLEEWKSEFNTCMSKRFTFDQNRNAQIDESEKSMSVSMGVR